MPTKARKHQVSSSNARSRQERSLTSHKTATADRSISKPSANNATLFSVLVALAAVMYLLVNSGIFKSDRNSRAVGEEPVFDVVDIPRKGKGLIARRDIQPGELLIKEKPLILVPSSTNASPAKLLKDRLSTLTPNQRDAYYSLSFVTPGKDDALSDDEITLAIIQTNGISAGDNVGLFPRTARLNHGCSAAFNSVYSWRSREGYLVVHAIKPIKRGQELLTTYTDTKRPRHERQAYLKSNYDFTCSCSVCSLPEADSAASDGRLARMNALYQTLASWGRQEIDGVRASQSAKEIWEVSEQEGYWSERGQLAADLVHVAAAHSDKRGVLAWANLAQAWYAIELGNDSTQALDMRALLVSPRSHAAWGSRQPQSIDLPS